MLTDTCRLMASNFQFFQLFIILLRQSLLQKGIFIFWKFHPGLISVEGISECNLAYCYRNVKDDGGLGNLPMLRSKSLRNICSIKTECNQFYFHHWCTNLRQLFSHLFKTFFPTSFRGWFSLQYLNMIGFISWKQILEFEVSLIDLEKRRKKDTKLTESIIFIAK